MDWPCIRTYSCAVININFNVHLQDHYENIRIANCYFAFRMNSLHSLQRTQKIDFEMKYLGRSILIEHPECNRHIIVYVSTFYFLSTHICIHSGEFYAIMFFTRFHYWQKHLLTKKIIFSIKTEIEKSQVFSFRRIFSLIVAENKLMHHESVHLKFIFSFFLGS